LVQPLILCSTSETDFDDVAALASLSEFIVPNFGLHPWWASTASPTLSEHLESRLKQSPGAGCGEIGLDASPRGILASPFEQQVKVFKTQLTIASKLQRPISVHCVQAYGPFLEALSESERNGEFLSGVLMHSFAGTCGFANQLIAQRGEGRGGGGKEKGGLSPLLFSFNGGVVSSASNAFDELRSKKDLSSSSSSLKQNEEKKVFRARGLSKDSLKVLQRLSHSHLCFETDTPDQPFLHHVSPTYLSWCRRVFGGNVDEEEAEDDDLGVTAEKESSCSISCCNDEPQQFQHSHDESTTTSTTTTTTTATTTTKSTTTTSSSAGEGSLELYREKEKSAKENRPVLVRHVLRAAAILRYSYGSRSCGLPLQMKPGALAAEEVERKSTCPSDGLAFLTIEPESLPLDITIGLRREYEELCVSSTNNVKAMFQWATKESKV